MKRPHALQWGIARGGIARRWFAAVVVGVAGISLASACMEGSAADGRAPGAAGETGTSDQGTSGSVLIYLGGVDPATGIAAVRVDVSQNGAVVASQTAQTGITPDAAAAPMADAYFVLPAGPYTILVTPLDVNGKPSATCSPASGKATVISSATEEITLTLACNGPANGGLDVGVHTSGPPLITGLTFAPSKYAQTCQEVDVTVAATDPNRETLVYDWAIVSRPASSEGGPPAVTSLIPSGSTASFFSDGAGDYSLVVTVTNADKASTKLTFPLHIVQGDSTDCNPAFDTLNPWSPAGPAEPGLVYGTRVHVMPSIPTPDPLCHLTRHPGGPVITSPTVVPVLWGSSAAVATTAQTLTPMFTDLLTNPQYAGYLGDLAAEYGTGSSGTVTPAPGSSTGFVIHPMHTAPILGVADVQNELASQLAANNLPTPEGPGIQTIYAIYFPSTVTLTTSQGSTCQDIFAYHGSFAMNGLNAAFLAIGACDSTFGRGLEHEASHELIEALTDPDVGNCNIFGAQCDLTWVDDTDSEPGCSGEIGDLCNSDGYMLGSYFLESSWSDATHSCFHASPPPSGTGKLEVTLTNVNFHTTGFNVFDHNPVFHTPAQTVIDCTPGGSPAIAQLGCVDNFGYFATVTCTAESSGAIQGTLQLDISATCSGPGEPAQNFEALIGNLNVGSSFQTPLTFTVNPGATFSSTTAPPCVSTNNNVPGFCTCQTPTQADAECERALNVCMSGYNVGSVDPCSREEIGTDFTAVILP